MHAYMHGTRTDTEGDTMSDNEKKLQADNKKLREALERIYKMAPNGAVWEIARKALEETK